MRYVRAWTRLLILLLATVLAYLFLMLGVLVVKLLRGNTARWPAVMTRIWSRVIATMIRMRIEVRGVPPQPPFFLVTNHLSYVDIVLLASQIDCVFVAKAEVDHWPFIGMISRGANTLFIDRNIKRDIPRVIALIEQSLDRGPGVVVFPEGTSSRGETVMDFKPALLEAAARVKLPVSYASVSYRTPPGAGSARDNICWWNNEPFPQHVFRLLQLPRFYASVDFGAESIREADRKLLATRLRQAVAEQFRPVA